MNDSKNFVGGRLRQDAINRVKVIGANLLIVRIRPPEGELSEGKKPYLPDPNGGEGTCSAIVMGVGAVEEYKTMSGEMVKNEFQVGDVIFHLVLHDTTRMAVEAGDYAYHIIPMMCVQARLEGE